MNKKDKLLKEIFSRICDPGTYVNRMGHNPGEDMESVEHWSARAVLEMDELQAAIGAEEDETHRSAGFQPAIQSTSPAASIKNVSISRLFNLGDYEHVKYELSAEVTDPARAGEVLRELEAAVKLMNPTPPVDQSSYERSKRICETPEDQLDGWEKQNLENHRENVRDYEKFWEDRRQNFARFNQLGVTETHTDAKDNWED